MLKKVSILGALSVLLTVSAASAFDGLDVKCATLGGKDLNIQYPVGRVPQATVNGKAEKVYQIFGSSNQRAYGSEILIIDGHTFILGLRADKNWSVFQDTFPQGPQSLKCAVVDTRKFNEKY